MDLTEIVAQIEALESKAAKLLENAEASTDSEAITGFKAVLDNEVMPEITKLQEARKEAEREAETKAIKSQVTSLEEVINELKKPIGNFHIGSKAVEADESENFSFFADVKLANKGRQESISRLVGVDSEGKAMSEGVQAQGGYLVRPTVERQIIETRELDNVLRALCSKLNVTSNEVSLDQLTLSTTAGWVAELAQKPEGTGMTLASVSASVFTAAGLATISNQLLADSNPAIDRLVTSDLAKRLVALEEAAFLSGSGTGQPLGILNTPGIQTVVADTPGDPAAVGGLIDEILDAIAKVQGEHGNPSAIVMHPRTWTRIIKSRDAQGLYVVGGGSIANGPTQQSSLLGYTVVLSNRVPINLGAGANESRVIVGDFTEALILDRQGITVDESPHVYFTSNQTVFRAEQRVGFTAARQPKAFCTVGGTGLANG